MTYDSRGDGDLGRVGDGAWDDEVGAALERPREIADPTTGILVRADDMQGVGEAIERLKQRKRDIDAVLGEFTDAVLEESRRLGTKTMTLRGFQIVVSPDTEVVWDVERLLELRDLGLPEERWNELVTTVVESKVSARVAGQLAKANPEYARVILAARVTQAKRQYASVKR